MRKYEDLNHISENRMPQRAFYIPKDGCISLNGDWDFKYYECDFEEDYIEKEWGTIDVPSCWQLRGYGNPNYANVAYPHPYDPPYVPNENPMGVYRKNLEIKDASRKTYIVFEGVSSCLELFVNGRYVGYTQGSHLQAEFDISDYVVNGNNEIVAKVRKWCSGSYLEDQDFFRFHGIFRDVYVLSRPLGHIRDIKIVTDDNNIDIVFDGKAEITLLDADKKVLGKKSAEGAATFTVENPILWNAEKPYLYELLFEYEGEVISQKIGFVTYKIGKDCEFLVNGVEVKLKGVNHHDTHPTEGWCMTVEDIRRDLLLMKKLNINTIRTSHYPPTPKFLELCDELGFYVLLETDLETHGTHNRNVQNPGYYDFLDNSEWTCSNFAWTHAYIERMERAYNRDKNHTSIFCWSTGNESGHGENHRAMIRFIRENDPHRLVHAEDASRASDLTEKYHRDTTYLGDYVDLHSKMYDPIPVIEQKLNDPNFKKPFFSCEYAHAMGNGPGDVCDYWELTYKHKNFIGGCVWEWADHTVIVDGVPKYGGDFEGEVTHDGNFCCDGMVFHDRSFKAGSLEIKAAYQYMDCTLEGDEITVLNRYNFTNLNEYEFKYEVKVDGEVVSTDTLVLDVEPAKTAKVKIALPEKYTLGAFVNCYLYDKEGYCVAQKQLELSTLREEKKLCDTPAKATENNNFIVFEGDGFKYTFSKNLGTFVSLIKNGAEQLSAPIRITTMRAPIDNEMYAKAKWYWKNPYNAENLDRTFEKTYECTLNKNVVTVVGGLAGVSRTPYFKYSAVYTVTADGRINVKLDGAIKEECPWLPRLGFEIKTPLEHSEFKYFGMGPYENYCDMNHASMIDFYESDADKEYVNYIMPQEHGNHIKTKLLEMKNGLLFESENMEINVSRYTAKTLMDAGHQDELVKSDFVNVRIDYKNSGLGSHSCGPELAEKYRLNEKKIHFEFSIR